MNNKMLFGGRGGLNLCRLPCSGEEIGSNFPEHPTFRVWPISCSTEELTQENATQTIELLELIVRNTERLKSKPYMLWFNSISICVQFIGVIITALISLHLLYLVHRIV